MKNNLFSVLLTFLVLSSAACQAPNNQKTNGNTQLLSTLERSNTMLAENSKIFLDKLAHEADYKKQFMPLATTAQKIKTTGDNFDQEIKNALKNPKTANIDYPALFGKYAALCELTKSEFLTLKQDAQAGKIAGVMIRDREFDEFLSQSPLVGKAQTALSKADFDKLKGDNLKAYLLMLQSDAISGVNGAMSFLIDHLPRLDLDNKILYDIISVSPKAGILLGEEFVAEISVAAYSSATPYHAISVNGTTLPTIDGKAVYKTRPYKIGTQSYTVNTSLTNPTTGEVIKSSKEFMYEVGVPMAYIETASSHVLYVGQDNPINVFASGVSSSDIGISASGTAGLSLAPNGKNSYIVKVAQQGTANITLTNRSSGKIIGTFTFTVK